MKRIRNLMIAVIAIPSLHLCLAQEDPQTVYSGEIDSKSDQSITLNVTPCQSAKTLQRISPYKITGSQKASCNGGRQYARVEVQQERSAKEPDDKQKDLLQNAAGKEKDKEKDKDKEAKPKPTVPSDNGKER